VVTIILYLLLLHVVNNVFTMVEYRLEPVVSVLVSALVFILVRHLVIRHVEGEESTGRLLPFTYRVCQTVLVDVVEGARSASLSEFRNLETPCCLVLVGDDNGREIRPGLRLDTSSPSM